MKRIIKQILLMALPALLMLGGCKTKQMPSLMAYQSHETECLGQDPSGRQRLRVWGEGKDASAAIENAKKKAVEDVVFRNITAGTGRCNSMPVLDSPVVRQNNREFFNKFFSGKYKKFIKGEKAEKIVRYTGNDQVVQEMEITVDREALIDYFIKEKILK